MNPAPPITQEPEQKTGASWPLLLLAGLSLVPGLGFFFGFAAACWGLVTDRPKGILAAAIGGVGALLNIAVILLIGAGLSDSKAVGGLAGSIAQAEMDTLVNHLVIYHTDKGSYPASLAELPSPGPGRPLPRLDHSIGLLNTTVEYHYARIDDGQDFLLRGAGKDGILETPDDILPSGWDAESDTTEAVEE